MAQGPMSAEQTHDACDYCRHEGERGKRPSPWLCHRHYIHEPAAVLDAAHCRQDREYGRPEREEGHPPDRAEECLSTVRPADEVYYKSYPDEDREEEKRDIAVRVHQELSALVLDQYRVVVHGSPFCLSDRTQSTMRMHMCQISTRTRSCSDIIKQ